MTDEQQSDNLAEQPNELAALQLKAQEYLDGWKRARADYQNLKKDTDKRQADIIQFANAALIADLLPIYNHFKLACQHIPADQKEIEWVKGFELIRNQCAEFFRQLGITEIKTVGQSFDPDMHEAVEQAEQPQYQSGIIFEEVSPGYTLHGKVVIPAKVKVTK